MRTLLAIGLLIAFRSFSQTPVIKVKNPLSQADAPWHVTISGKYSGLITKAEILSDPKLTISNNTKGLRIISYEIISRERGKLVSRANLPIDSIVSDLNNYVFLFDKKSKLIFDEVKAVNAANDTIFLNPLSFKLVD